MSQEADDFLNAKANWDFERLTKGQDLEYWLCKCRADAGRLIAGVA